MGKQWNRWLLIRNIILIIDNLNTEFTSPYLSQLSHCTMSDTNFSTAATVERKHHLWFCTVQSLESQSKCGKHLQGSVSRLMSTSKPQHELAKEAAFSNERNNTTVVCFGAWTSHYVCLWDLHYKMWSCKNPDHQAHQAFFYSYTAATRQLSSSSEVAMIFFIFSGI